MLGFELGWQRNATEFIMLRSADDTVPSDCKRGVCRPLWREAYRFTAKAESFCLLSATVFAVLAKV